MSIEYFTRAITLKQIYHKKKQNITGQSFLVNSVQFLQSLSQYGSIVHIKFEFFGVRGVATRR